MSPMSATMGVIRAVVWWTVLVLAAKSAAEKNNFTDIIIGEQRLVSDASGLSGS